MRNALTTKMGENSKLATYMTVVKTVVELNAKIVNVGRENILA